MDWKEIFPHDNRYYESEDGIIYNAHVLEILKQFPDESVDLIITSSPYWSLRNYQVEGQIGIVLDPFTGSGTSLYMARKLHRKWIGIDLNSDYCEIAKRRVASLNSEQLSLSQYK